MGPLIVTNRSTDVLFKYEENWFSLIVNSHQISWIVIYDGLVKKSGIFWGSIINWALKVASKCFGPNLCSKVAYKKSQPLHPRLYSCWKAVSGCWRWIFFFIFLQICRKKTLKNLRNGGVKVACVLFVVTGMRYRRLEVAIFWIFMFPVIAKAYLENVCLYGFRSVCSLVYCSSKYFVVNDLHLVQEKFGCVLLFEFMFNF